MNEEMWGFGFKLLMALTGANATLGDYELTQVATFKTEQACEAAAKVIAAKELELVSRSKKHNKGVRVEHLCVNSGS